MKANVKVKGINLLPREYIIAERVSLIEKGIAAILVLEVICFIAFLAIPPKQEIAQTQQELEAKQNEVKSKRYDGVNKTLNDLAVAKDEMTKWNNQYSTLKQENYISGELLDELVARVPQGFNLTTMNIESTVSEKDGSATRTLKIDALADTLQQGVAYVSVLETLYPSEGISHEIAYDKQVGRYKVTISINKVDAAPEVPNAQDENKAPAEGGTE